MDDTCELLIDLIQNIQKEGVITDANCIQFEVDLAEVVRRKIQIVSRISEMRELITSNWESQNEHLGLLLHWWNRILM